MTSALMTAPRLQVKTDEQLEELKDFYNEIAYSFVIFDPLDRPIPVDDDQATK